jgi:hypothetical protein
VGEDAEDTSFPRALAFSSVSVVTSLSHYFPKEVLLTFQSGRRDPS